MSDEFEVQQEALLDFARFADAKWIDLEPWSSLHATDFHPTPAAFGAVSADTVDVEYQYWPLTPEEFEQEKNITLNPNRDPGPEVLQTFGTTGANVASYIARYGQYVNIGTLLVGQVDWGMDTEVADWFEYYAARGPGGGTMVFDAEPTDAPWAAKLHGDWCAAVDNRLKEVDEVRNEIDFLVPLLADAAQRYADVDVTNAVSLDKYADPGSYYFPEDLP
ncbi:hypothetical protein LX16_4284 [Stackebrandtia albiflava]|uniref:Uncharacterized protein n=1 Tax=Stackebrandtia albiflava TaxID=406432 RepID=A0A562UR31_9ACTN|nr:hypothetical protein [Stackebrandtia albiflava]TWJ08064.1 hypothetical protein LX16_4284 [Stackebrandtia albiflava]